MKNKMVISVGLALGFFTQALLSKPVDIFVQSRIEKEFSDPIVLKAYQSNSKETPDERERLKLYVIKNGKEEEVKRATILGEERVTIKGFNSDLDKPLQIHWTTRSYFKRTGDYSDRETFSQNRLGYRRLLIVYRDRKDPREIILTDYGSAELPLHLPLPDHIYFINKYNHSPYVVLQVQEKNATLYDSTIDKGSATGPIVTKERKNIPLLVKISPSGYPELMTEEILSDVAKHGLYEIYDGKDNKPMIRKLDASHKEQKIEEAKREVARLRRELAGQEEYLKQLER